MSKKEVKATNTAVNNQTEDEQVFEEPKAYTPLGLKLSKVGLIFGVVTQVLAIVLILLDTYGNHDNAVISAITDGSISYIIWGSCGLIAHILCGSLLSLLGSIWKVSKKLAFVGWLIIPFPYDILTGLFTLCMGIMMGVVLIGAALLVVPLPINLYVFFKRKRAYETGESAM